jgi:hypothetical protein
MAQLTHTQYSGGLLAGVVSESPLTKIDSYVAEGALSFGLGVQQGSSDLQVELAAAGGTLLGIAVRDHKYANDQATDILDGQGVAVLTKGVITGEITGTVAKNAVAYIEITAGADQGKFTNLPDTAANLLCGKFLQGGVDGDIVLIEIEL